MAVLGSFERILGKEWIFYCKCVTNLTIVKHIGIKSKSFGIKNLTKYMVYKFCELFIF